MTFFLWEVFHVKLLNSKVLHIWFFINIGPGWIGKWHLYFWGTFSLYIYIYIFFFYESKQLIILKADMYWCKMRVLSLPKTETKVGRNIDYWLCWILFTNNNLFPFWYLKKNCSIQNTAVNGPKKIKENIITKLFDVQKFDYFRFL